MRACSRLRAEAADAFPTPADWADPQALKKLVLADSALQESLRRSSIQTRGLLRQVVAENGVVLPDGTHLAHGTWVGVPVEAVHMDEQIYANPLEYDPFRFAKSETEKDVTGQGNDATKASDTFLPWSYGRFAW